MSAARVTVRLARDDELEACIERARASGRSGIVLSTPPEWTVGQRLYEGLGFVRVPERDHEPVEGFTLWAYALPL